MPLQSKNYELNQKFKVLTIIICQTHNLSHTGLLLEIDLDTTNFN